MTFNQLKEYHLKHLTIILQSGEEVNGIITSHHYNEENTDIVSISVLNKWKIERVVCAEIKEVKIISGFTL